MTAGWRSPGSVLAAATVAGAAWASAVSAQQVYPAWFLMPPDDPAIAVGYAPAYRVLDSAVAEATRDGLVRLALARGTRARAGGVFEAGPGGRTFVRAERYEEGPATADTSTARRLAAAAVGNMMVVLVAARDIPAPADRLMPLPPDAPAWMARLPVGDAVRYAVGAAPRYFYEKNGWLEAEWHARQQLAFGEAVAGDAFDDGVPGVDAAVRTLTRDVVVATPTVVGRWRDATPCYVLMRAAGGGSRRR